MSLPKKEDDRRDELVGQGKTGATNSELHNLNVQNNKDRSDEELFRTIEARPDGGPQARRTLRSRGYDV